MDVKCGARKKVKDKEIDGDNNVWSTAQNRRRDKDWMMMMASNDTVD